MPVVERSWTPEKRGAQGPGIGCSLHRSRWRRLGGVDGVFGGVCESRTDDVHGEKNMELHTTIR